MLLQPSTQKANEAMSTDYYLVCKIHKIGVFIADNKGNPIDPVEWKPFYMNHVLHNGSQGCEIVFCSEGERMDFKRPYTDPAIRWLRDGFSEQDDYYFV